MNEDFVSYQQAVILSECGFDWECHAHYTNDYINTDPEDLTRVVRFHREWSSPYNHNRVVGRASAPTLWQAQKWLREVHSLHVEISTHGKRFWQTSITGYNEEDIPIGYLNPVNIQTFDSYEQALSAGITAALELIEKKGE